MESLNGWDPDPMAEMNRALDRAVHDGRVIGTVFIALGLLACWLGMAGIRMRGAQLMAAVSGLVLIGPGVMYLVAAAALRRRSPRGAVWARWAGRAHVAAIAMLFVIGSLHVLPLGPMATFVPAMLAVFFVPALLAFLAETGKAERAARLFEPTGRAFQPLPALPVGQPVLQPPPPLPEATPRHD